MPASTNKGNGAGLSPRELAVLLEISRVITSSLPLANMFEMVHAYLSEILSYNVGCLYIKEKSRFNLKAGVGTDDDAFESLGSRAGTNFLLKKIKGTGRPWRSTQILDREQLLKNPFYVQVLEPLNLFHTAGAPVRDGYKILGSVHLGRSESAGDFNEKEMQILEIVANLLSPAVHNIRIKQISWQTDGLAVSGNDCRAKGSGYGNSGHVIEDQRMQVLGSVSSVMAQELRNPLSTLKMSFYSLARNYSNGVMAEQDLNQMSRSIKKIEKTVSFMLSLAQDLNLSREWVDINELMNEVIETLGPVWDPDVVIIKDYSPLPKMYLDREKMHTVFGNIIENALDAMPGGGRLHLITTENQGHIYIILEDNGLGVAKEVCKNVFEPFISTKPNGIGLGLTVCERIIGSHGGKIKFRSNIGKGTAVCIDIPVNTD